MPPVNRIAKYYQDSGPSRYARASMEDPSIELVASDAITDDIRAGLRFLRACGVIDSKTTQEYMTAIHLMNNEIRPSYRELAVFATVNRLARRYGVEGGVFDMTLEGIPESDAER